MEIELFKGIPNEQLEQAGAVLEEMFSSEAGVTLLAVWQVMKQQIALSAFQGDTAGKSHDYYRGQFDYHDLMLGQIESLRLRHRVAHAARRSARKTPPRDLFVQSATSPLA